MTDLVFIVKVGRIVNGTIVICDEGSVANQSIGGWRIDRVFKFLHKIPDFQT